MIKSKGTKGKVRVTFTVDPEVGAQAAAVCGDWNDWSPGADVMQRDGDGGQPAGDAAAPAAKPARGTAK